MAKIIKLGSQNITPSKVANPFRTSRNSTTNPFKYSNFEGNTLQFADVFEGFEPKKETNKMKMIASSVAGSMNKIKSSITEPIVNFVNRVCENVANAWDYAKNTNVSDLAPIKAVSDVLNTDVRDLKDLKPIKAISNALSTDIMDLAPVKAISGALSTDVKELAPIKAISETLNKPVEIPGLKGLDNAVAGLKNSMSETTAALNENIAGLGKNISGKWNEMIAGLHASKKISAETPVADLESMWKKEIALSNAEVA